MDLWPGVRLEPPVWTEESGTRRGRLSYHPHLIRATLGAVSGYLYPDISPHTPVTDWSAFWTAYPVAVAKATEGRTWRSSQWPTFLAQARKRGRLPVAYHFLWPGSSSPISEQASNFVSYAWDGKPMGVMLDVETTGTGANPTVQDASAWLSVVSRLTGVPRSRMLVYMPRWWWQTHGAGNTSTRDTLLVNADYRTIPNLTPYAGYARLDALQFGSTVQIAGVGAGDCNRWLDSLSAAGMAAAMFGGGTVILSKDDIEAIGDELEQRFTHNEPVGTSLRTALWNLNVRAINTVLGDGDNRPAKDLVDWSDDNPARQGLASIIASSAKLDVSQLTTDQLTLIGSVFAARTVISGIEAADGKVTITFEPAA